MRQYIIRREEWMAAMALLNGKVIVVGEGVNAEVDFQRDASLSFALASGDKWNADTSKPLDNLVDWKQLISKLSAGCPPWPWSARTWKRPC